MRTLREQIEHSINCCSAENGSNTPDFILAEYLTDCLAAYDKAVTARDRWHNRASLNPVSDPLVFDETPLKAWNLPSSSPS